MLKVTGSIKVVSFYMDIDDYVPFTFRCQDTTSIQPLYWRTGDLKKSMLAIGLNQDSGAMCSLTVTSIDAVGPLNACELLPVLDPLIEEMPVCDISNWSNWSADRYWEDRYRDEPSDFLTLVGEDKVCIKLGTQSLVNCAYKIGNLIIGVDPEDNLSWLEIRNLSTVDIRKMTRNVLMS